MYLILDHYFILTDPGAPAADLVSSIGLIEGAANHHPGQGSSNRRFFMANSCLEFLYLRDADEAENGPGKELRFADRQADAKASPFGLIVRQDKDSSEAPFPAWRYCPDYFRDDQYFQVGENSDLLQEPLCICMPPNLQRPENSPPPENPDWFLTELRISVPVTQASPPLTSVAKCQGINLRLDEPHLLELEFNQAQKGRLHDLRPSLPLIIRC